MTLRQCGTERCGGTLMLPKQITIIHCNSIPGVSTYFCYILVFGASRKKAAYDFVNTIVILSADTVGLSG